MNKRIFIFLTIIIATSLAIVTYLQAYQNLEEYMQMGQTLTKQDLINKIFIFPDYIQYEYMNQRDFQELLPPTFFFLITICWAAFP
ncbi:MAG: hypothetical protein LBV67_06435, partial [Streptococcaceae bacterium]|nr:hypothetical protein [Streptococcaceae bacterium]